MLNKLDWYIIKRFLLTFLVALSLFTIIILIFDISEKVDDFVEKKAPFKKIVFEYFFNFIPYILNLFSPIFVFISVIFFTSKLASKSEIVAILASGVSYIRLLRPYFITASFLGLITFLLNAYFIPRTEKSRINFENQYVRNLENEYKEDIKRQIQPGVIMSLDAFNLSDSIGRGFNLEKISNGKLVSKLYGDMIRWNPENSKWRISNFRKRDFLSNGNEKLTFGPTLDTSLKFNPSDFFRRDEDVQSFNMKELDTYIALEKMRGTGQTFFYETEKYRRYLSPLSLIILTMIGVCVSSRKSRGGIGLSLGIGLIISFAYLFIIQWFNSYGSSGSIPPLIAVIIPNLVFAIIGLFLYFKAQK